ncbi:MAG: glycine cleavage system protein R [Sulfurihydrogenibium sp.]|uniref:glycine cleavage system protein R n=1 Tax=Sulfurihydrogenibium sp. TaxID=2053621 RepID=UPI000CAB29A9|nr:MAG: amino acid-binding protein [Sulfurihydrogenibium sp.]PMP76875.1 MAG: amino acid-binding protein [Sulfurihydrogenibium sp.]
MKQFIITAFGEDRPGIVAKVTEILYKNGLNIEDSAMTRLNDEFVIMLVVKGDTEKSSLENDLKSLEKEGINFTVKEVPLSKEKEKEDYQLYNIIVYGSDKPGIVYNVSKLLAEKSINIADLRTEKTKDLYVMFIQAEIPNSLDITELEKEVESLKDNLNVDISLQCVDTANL